MDRRTTELAAYAAALRYEDLSEEAVHECKRRLIDTLACAVGAFDAEPSRIARAVARRHVGKPPARILGTLESSTLEHAAFANGVMLRYADYNDAYFTRSSGHPSDNIAAVLAVADALRSKGRAVITATALAYEVFCNFSDVLPREQGFDYVLHTAVASAAAAAKLLGVTEAQMAQAISLAVTPNLALEQVRLGELSMWKGCASGNASRNGIFAALLAEQGLTGPDEAIEGRGGLQRAVGAFEWAPFGGRGGPFRVCETHIKYYPAVVHSQSPITAAVELAKQVTAEEIEATTVDSYWVANRFTDRTSPWWRPATRETADHSLPYIIAAALIDGTLSEASFSPERLSDPRIRDLMARMTIREDAAFTAAHPASWWCRIEVVTRTGARKSVQTEYFKGHARNPLSDAELEQKFRQLTECYLDAKRASQILDALWRIDAITDVSEVIDLLKFAEAGT